MTLTEATAHRDAARVRFNSATPGSPAWREFEETLNFWQGKVAMLAVQHDTSPSLYPFKLDRHVYGEPASAWRKRAGLA